MRGLMAIIPADAWRAISPTCDLNGFLCPWCMSDRLKALRLEVCCELHLCLPYLDAKNIRALRQAAEIEHQRVLEKRAANGADGGSGEVAS